MVSLDGVFRSDQPDFDGLISVAPEGWTMRFEASNNVESGRPFTVIDIEVYEHARLRQRGRLGWSDVLRGVTAQNYDATQSQRFRRKVVAKRLLESIDIIYARQSGVDRRRTPGGRGNSPEVRHDTHILNRRVLH
jgi:hypothetical protein